MQKLNASAIRNSERLSAIKAQPKDLRGCWQDDASIDNHRRRFQMNRRTSIAQRLVLITLATLASTSTFALMVLAPIATGGGLV